MTEKPFNILVIGQAGRVGYEACLLAASLSACDPDAMTRLIVAEPQPGPLWKRDPRMNSAQRKLLLGLGATILPFENREFGQSYPQGNKIEALSVLPEGEPFLFLDSDTLAVAPISGLQVDFGKPTASLLRTDTWPKPSLYGPKRHEIWQSLYDRFDLDFEASQDKAWPEQHWRRYLYFNAGWFFADCPRVFGARYLSIAGSIKRNTPDAIACQPLDPWLDQVALPLAIADGGGGREGPHDTLDGGALIHYRALPLLFAQAAPEALDQLHAIAAPNKIKKVLKEYEPFRRMIYQDRGTVVRNLVRLRGQLPREPALRRMLREQGLWMR